MIEQTYECHEISIYSVKDSQKFKDIQAIIASKLLAYDSWVLWCKFHRLNFYSLNLHITDMIPVLEVAPMVPSFSKESQTSKRIVDSLIEKYLYFCC